MSNEPVIELVSFNRDGVDYWLVRQGVVTRLMKGRTNDIGELYRETVFVFSDLVETAFTLWAKRSADLGLGAKAEFLDVAAAIDAVRVEGDFADVSAAIDDIKE